MLKSQLCGGGFQILFIIRDDGMPRQAWLFKDDVDISQINQVLHPQAPINQFTSSIPIIGLVAGVRLID